MTRLRSRPGETIVPGKGSVPLRAEELHEATAPGSRRCPEAPLAKELFTIHNLIMRLGDRLVADLGVTGSRWLLLGAIAEYDEPPTLSQLSDDAMLSVQNVSRMIAAMEADGLVRRSTREGDGRRTYVRLTARGVRVKDAAHERCGVLARALLRGMDRTQVKRTEMSLDRIIDNLEQFETELDARGDAAIGADEESGG